MTHAAVESTGGDRKPIQGGKKDCVLLIGPGFPQDQAAEAELLAGLPFLETNLVNQADFDLLVDKIFATDRHAVANGLVEILP